MRKGIYPLPSPAVIRHRKILIKKRGNGDEKNNSGDYRTKKDPWDIKELIKFLLTMTSEKDSALLGENRDDVIVACTELHNAVRGTTSSSKDSERIKRAQEFCNSAGISQESQEAIEECAKMIIGKIL